MRAGSLHRAGRNALFRLPVSFSPRAERVQIRIAKFFAQQAKKEQVTA